MSVSLDQIYDDLRAAYPKAPRDDLARRAALIMKGRMVAPDRYGRPEYHADVRALAPRLLPPTGTSEAMARLVDADRLPDLPPESPVHEYAACAATYADESRSPTERYRARMRMAELQPHAAAAKELARRARLDADPRRAEMTARARAAFPALDADELAHRVDLWIETADAATPTETTSTPAPSQTPPDRSERLRDMVPMINYGRKPQ